MPAHRRLSLTSLRFSALPAIPGLTIGALIAVVIASAACGGGGDTPLLRAPGGEVRPTVAVDNRVKVVVALEARGATGKWGATAHPQDREVEERAAGDDWWYSSEMLLEVSAAITLSVEDEAFLIEPPAAGFSDDCGILFAGPSERDDQRSLHISPVGGAACAEWLPPLTVTAPDESFNVTTRIAAQRSGDCAAIRVDVRDRINRWRSLPTSRICGLEEQIRAAAADGEGLPSRPGAAGIVPLSENSRAIELRSIASGVSAGIDGRKLSTECGLQLERGFLTVWQHRYDTDTCEWVFLERIVEIDDGPVPDDLLDEQQYKAYDWEQDVTSNLLSGEWRRPVSLDQAKDIVSAIYNDFVGSTAQPPVVAAAPPGAEFAGAYDTAAHAIQLRPDGRSASVVLHETAHALLRLSLPGEAGYYLAPRHGAEFAALLIALWERYVNDFDAGSAALLADVYGVYVFPSPPIHPVGDAATRQAVREAIAVR